MSFVQINKIGVSKIKIANGEWLCLFFENIASVGCAIIAAGVACAVAVASAVVATLVSHMRTDVRDNTTRDIKHTLVAP